MHHLLCNLWYLRDDLEHFQQLTSNGSLLLEILLKPTHSLARSHSVFSQPLNFPLFQLLCFCWKRLIFIQVWTLSRRVPWASVAAPPHLNISASKHADGEQMLIWQLFKYSTKTYSRRNAWRHPGAAAHIVQQNQRSKCLKLNRKHFPEA